MLVRRADDDDVAAIAAVRLSNGPAHDDSGANAAYCRHLIRHGHLMVAEESGVVVGFGGAVDMGGARLLSDLYVHAGAHGRGVGKSVLEAVLAGAAECLTFASNDPATIPLYSRAGMVCRWPLLTLEGSVQLLPHSPVEVSAVDAITAASVERGITGVDRTTDHQYWHTREGSHAVVLENEGRIVGAGALLVGADRCRVEHLAAHPGSELDAVAALVRWSAVAGVELYVPGDRDLALHLLRRGFRVADTGVHMSTAAAAVHPLLCVLHPGLG